MSQKSDKMQSPQLVQKSKPRNRSDSYNITPSWLSEIHAQAKKRLEIVGLPNRRHEYWKYTDPRKLQNLPNQTGLPPNKVPVLQDKLGVIQINSDELNLDNLNLNSNDVVISTLINGSTANKCFKTELFGKLETAASEMIPRGFAIENTSRANQGLLILCKNGTQSAIQIFHKPRLEIQTSYQHHLIVVEPGGELHLTESGAKTARSNTVFEVYVKAGGSFHFERALGSSQEQTASLCSVFAEVEKEGRFHLFGLSAYSPWVRNECVVWLKGDNAKANLAGAFLGGKGCHHDDTVLVIHEGENCESRQVYKKVLQDDSKGVFQGKILVQPGAQKTDGYQISQGLLLSDDSQFLAKPELEIYADDVACSHGSTSGGVNEEAMFYLRSRGIGKQQAQELLALAFLADAIDEIKDEHVHARVTDLASAWFARGY